MQTLFQQRRFFNIVEMQVQFQQRRLCNIVEIQLVLVMQIIQYSPKIYLVTEFTQNNRNINLAALIIQNNRNIDLVAQNIQNSRIITIYMEVIPFIVLVRVYRERKEAGYCFIMWQQIKSYVHSLIPAVIPTLYQYLSFLLILVFFTFSIFFPRHSLLELPFLLHFN